MDLHSLLSVTTDVRVGGGFFGADGAEMFVMVVVTENQTTAIDPHIVKF